MILIQNQVGPINIFPYYLLVSILILYYHLFLHLISCLFPSGFPTNTTYTFDYILITNFDALIIVYS